MNMRIQLLHRIHFTLEMLQPRTCAVPVDVVPARVLHERQRDARHGGGLAVHRKQVGGHHQLALQQTHPAAARQHH